MLIVEGAIIDANGSRAAYVRFRDGKIIEVGQTGTHSTRGRVRKVKGIVLPAPGNGHTHLADSVSKVEPPHRPVEELVQAPQGLKFRILRDSPRRAKVLAI